jgi:AmiR/NasT family two-component response regulator
LNLYATETFAFDNDGESIALLLAAHAGVAMAALRNKTNFDVALASRDLIGQAKGILMERFKVNANDAFGLLILASQHANRKLRDVAGELVSTGELNLG